MKDALQIFTAGLGGVFTGMTLLYIAIRRSKQPGDVLTVDVASGGTAFTAGAVNLLVKLRTKMQTQV